MVARVNGEEWSRGELADLHHGWGDLLAHASRDTRLRPGDVIGSGTVGTGCILELGLVHGRDRYPYLRERRRGGARGRRHRRAPQPHRLTGGAAYGPAMASTDLTTIAPAFVEMAHRIVWCTVGHRQPRRRGADPHPPPVLGVGRRRAHRVDPHQPEQPEGAAPRRQPARVAHLLGPPPTTPAAPTATPRGSSPPRSAGRAGIASSTRPAPVGLRPEDHPAVDRSRRPRVRCAAPRAHVAAGDARHRDAAGPGRHPHLAGADRVSGSARARERRRHV